MTRNKIDSTGDIKTDAHLQKDEILQKADRLLSVIKNINREGGITTQLMMAAACIELQNYDWYLQDTYCEKVIDRNDFPNLHKLEEYIRLFKDIDQDLWNDLYGEHHTTNQREEDIEIIYSLKEVIIDHDNLRQYEENYLDSWIDIKTDINMLSVILNYLLRIVVSELENIYQEIRKQEVKTTPNILSPEKHITRNNFREYIIDPSQYENVLERLHELIDGKKPKTCALTIFAAQQKGMLTQPSYKALHESFKEIGDRKNYRYYLQRKENYKDDIDAIEKSL